MTPAQLAEDIERRNREAQAVFSVAAGDRTGLNPVVAEALASQQHASGQSPLTQIATQVAQQSVSQPASVGTPVINPNAPDPRVPVQAPDTESQPQSFADLIMQNDAVRLRNKEAFDRREKADKARLTIAAVTDALASLGNLVGTTQGAFSQPQTYQVPFVHEDAERARAEARNTANMLLRNDQSLRVAQMREDSANSASALRQALEEERTRRAQMNNDARVALAQENARLKGELYEKQHGYKTEEQEQKFADQKQIADDRNSTTLQAAGIRAGATKYAADKRAENSVGGYTTETTYQYEQDEYGNWRKVGETKTRGTGNGGGSTTTTTGSGSGSGKVKFNVGNDDKKKKGKKANLK